MTDKLMLTKQFFITCFEKIADLVEEQRDHWSKLDSDIGDGDHGINLSIGFRAVNQQLPTLARNGEDLNKLFKQTGMILLGKVGGASGPLYGSLLMKMGTDLEDKYEVTFEEFIQMLDYGIAGVIFRGKAELGDKTMIDALLPGINYLKTSPTSLPASERMVACVNVMKNGAEGTVPLQAKKGRALRLGPRSIGHKDPGAESAWMIINIFAEEILNMNS